MAIGGHMVKKMCKWMGLFVVLVIVVYAAWVIVAMNRVATISVDYVAKVNEVASAVPEDDRAWPLYRKAGIALRKKEMPSTVFSENDFEDPTWPSEAGWEYYAEWVDAHQGTLVDLRDASKKKGMGFYISGCVSEADKELWPEEYESQGDAPHDGFMMSVLFPQLGPMRNMANLLAYDAKQAAFDGDASRCLQDITTMLQMGKHLREHPILINDLVSFAIYNSTFATIGDIVEHKQALFSNEQFETIKQSLAELDGYMTIRLEGERYFMLDILQRMYTDDGNGDGCIVPLDAMKLTALTESVSEGSVGTSLVPAFISPLADIFLASRKEMFDEYTVRMDKTESAIGTPLYELRQKPELLNSEEYPPSSTLDPYFLINLLMPALEKAVLHGEYTRARRDATLAVLYAVQQHNETDVWPLDLAEAGVVDGWNGEPLKITLVDGEPIIYSVGFDLEDDGGVFQKGAPRWSENFDNDWVIWPNVK